MVMKSFGRVSWKNAVQKNILIVKIMKWSIIVFISVVFLSSIAYSSDWKELSLEGYVVIDETQVDGEFEGCEFDKRILFTNGLVFICSEYSYSYSYMPDVYILKNIHSGNIIVIIDDEEYDGTLYRRNILP